MKRVIKWSIFAIIWAVAVFYCYLPYIGTMVDRTWYINMVATNILCLFIFGDTLTKGKMSSKCRNFLLEK